MKIMSEHPESTGESAPDPSVPYSERVVGFVDILGFEDLVRLADSDPRLRHQIIGALDAVSSVRTFDTKSADLKVQNFSDSLIVSATASDVGLMLLLLSLNALTSRLLDIGVFVRGGITIGKIYHDARIVFGVGVNEAYRLESSVAKVPRIVLSGEVLKFMRRNDASEMLTGYLKNGLLRDKDGVWHLHLFRGLTPVAKSRAELQKQLDRLRLIRRMIQNRLDETVDRPDVYAKIEWVAKRWNEMVSGERTAEGDLLSRIFLAGEEWSVIAD